MNDRFKFRFWSKTHNCYVDVLDLVGWEINKKIPVWKKGNLLSTEETKNVIPEQCTGLKDKNGNLIYENDIVSVPYIDPIFYQPANIEINDDKAVVEYFKGCFVVHYPEKTRKYLYDYENRAEVIGAIHENPELMEQSND